MFEVCASTAGARAAVEMTIIKRFMVDFLWQKPKAPGSSASRTSLQANG
jgi:hypothetical protein